MSFEDKLELSLEETYYIFNAVLDYEKLNVTIDDGGI